MSRSGIGRIPITTPNKIHSTITVTLYAKIRHESFNNPVSQPGSVFEEASQVLRTIWAAQFPQGPGLDLNWLATCSRVCSVCMPIPNRIARILASLGVRV